MVDVPDEYSPREHGDLLSTGAVMRLLGIRSRDTVMEWRKKGFLVGYRQPGGHYRYPSRQPALTDALGALTSTAAFTRAATSRQQHAARQRARVRAMVRPEDYR